MEGQPSVPADGHRSALKSNTQVLVEETTRMWQSRLFRFAFFAASIFVVCWIVFRAINPAWTNYCVLTNGDGTYFGEVELAFSSEDGSSAPDVHKIFVGERLGAIAVLPIRNALSDCTLSISDHSGKEIGKIDFNPPGRYYRTAVISLDHAHCKLAFGGLPLDSTSSMDAKVQPEE